MTNTTNTTNTTNIKGQPSKPSKPSKPSTNEFLQGGFTAIPKASSSTHQVDGKTDTFAAEVLLAGLAVFVLYVIYVFHKDKGGNNGK
jgi:hypothetical protein